MASQELRGTAEVRRSERKVSEVEELRAGMWDSEVGCPQKLRDVAKCVRGGCPRAGDGAPTAPAVVTFVRLRGGRCLASEAFTAEKELPAWRIAANPDPALRLKPRVLCVRGEGGESPADGSLSLYVFSPPEAKPLHPWKQATGI